MSLAQSVVQCALTGNLFNEIWSPNQTDLFKTLQGGVQTNFKQFSTLQNIKNIHRKKQKRSRIKRSKKKEELPVVFLPSPDPEDCEKRAPGMSAFAFMSFAMAMVNGAVNVANNVNNNNNNNNNNDNDNNNNVANINIANANNNANNMNMVTAGRRRRKIVPGSLQTFEPGEIISEQDFDENVDQNIASHNFSTNSITLTGDRYAIKAIRIGYTGEDSTPVNKNENNSEKIEDEIEFEVKNRSEDHVVTGFNANKKQDDLEKFNLLKQFLGLQDNDQNINSIINQFSNYFKADHFYENLTKFLTENLESKVAKTVQQGTEVLKTLKENLPIGKRRRRNVKKVSTISEDVSLTGLMYIDMFLHLIGSDSTPGCVVFRFCEASKSAKLLGPFADKLSNHLSDFAAELLIPNYRIDPEFLKNVTSMAKIDNFDCNLKFSDC